MRIAVPVSNGKLTQHFGHCPAFALVEADPQNKSIVSSVELPAPVHAPGVRPRWLREQGVDLVIAGGMGDGARSLLDSCSIQVITGAPAETPESLVRSYLEGALTAGANDCDHSQGGGHSCRHGQSPRS
jgi:ATP-binding protein involved in chromosome partitioning